MSRVQYTEYVVRTPVSRPEWDRWHGLMELENVSKPPRGTKSLAAKPNDEIKMDAVKFDDGTTVTFNLVSDDETYKISADIILETGYAETKLAREPRDLDVEIGVMCDENKTCYCVVFCVIEGEPKPPRAPAKRSKKRKEGTT